MFKRISKRQARKAFNNGQSISLLPNNVRFYNVWIAPYSINKETQLNSFDSIVSHYEYYNCNGELGTRAAYYITVF